MKVSLRVLPADRDDVLADIIRVAPVHRPNTKAGHVVKVSAGSRSGYFVVRGSKQNQPDVIALDDSARSKLGVKIDDRQVFCIERAGFWGNLVWAWKATDAMPRIGARLGVISVALGFVGCFFGIWSIYITIFGN